MLPHLAAAICYIGIAGLFYLDRDKTVHTSKALWLPVIYLWITGSRSVSGWLGIAPPPGVNTQLEGSPVDRLFFQVLLAAGVLVLIGRGSRTSALLKTCWPILLYFSYCLISVLWSPYPDVAFKRWTKAIGDLVMVLVVVTEVDLTAALRRFLSRTGFILLPLSVLLIKYFNDLGRGYGPSGEAMNTGVTTNKNTLGVITFILTLGAVWQVLTLLGAKGQPNRGRHLLAQGTLLAFGVAVLAMAHSATSVACFGLGTVLMVATRLPMIRGRASAVHALILTIMIAGAFMMLFGGEGAAVHALGRQSNFTGRTEIWKAVIPAVPNELIGAGFESFWITPSCMDKVADSLAGWWNPRGLNEAHDGYIEVYLNLGWVGVGLIALIIISGYMRAVAAFRRDPGISSLLLAYIATAAIYSITEAGFRLLTPIWIFLLLALVGAGRIASGAIGGAPEAIDGPVHPDADVLTSDTYALHLLRSND
jgi:O-antigen ligase